MTQQPKVSLVEVFAAPQGEGHNAGRWAVFVRLAGCPLACEFAPGVLCDTPYMQAKMKVTLDELFIDIVPSLYDAFQPGPGIRVGRDQVPMLIFTGGEPTACPLFDALISRALFTPMYIAVETNGVKWRHNLGIVDFICVSPKEHVPQTSQARWHNHNPQNTILSPQVCMELRRRLTDNGCSGEYRYVIAADTPIPPYHEAPYHYLSPAVQSDGSGEEWKVGFPGFAPGAVERCLTIASEDPRWRISSQQHKFWGVR